MAAPHADNFRKRVQISVGLVVVLLAAGGGIFMFLESRKKPPAQSTARKLRTTVLTIPARRGPYQEILRGYGLARALRQTEVSAEVTGIIRTISPKLEAGAEVDATTVLIQLDRREFQEAWNTADARREQAQAALERAEVEVDGTQKRLAFVNEELDAAKRELVRSRGLAEQGVITKSDLDRQIQTTNLKERQSVELTSLLEITRKNLGQAKAELKAAKAALARTQLDLDRTTISAPYAGRIETRRARVGARVAPGTVLFTVVDLSRIEIPVAIGASRFGEVRKKAKATIRLTEGGPIVWKGEVVRISPSVVSRDRTFFIYLVVTSKPDCAPVPPGAFVLAEVEGLLHRNVIPIPRIAFVGKRIYIATPDGEEAMIHERTPEVARLLPEVALITGGIEDDERIVVTNLEQIADGSRVLLVVEERAESGHR